MTKKILALVVLLILGVSLLGFSQTDYEDFYRQLITSMAEQVEEDADWLDTLLDSWSEGDITQTSVVENLQEMEKRADGYFASMLKLSPLEGKFDRHKQTVYVFVTWSTIIGMFTEGMADMDLAKLDAAATLSDFFQRKVEKFDESIIEPDGED